jgi:uncharacterized coiled-coil protein SlyX
MNIPLDNLYHWVQSIIPVPAVIYRFYPHGSKNIVDLTSLSPRTNEEHYVEHYVDIPVVVHDQEPLDYNLYTNIDLASLRVFIQQLHARLAVSNPTATEIRCQALVDKNLLAIPLASGSLHDQAILLHSEKNSVDLEQYSQNNFLPVYYWCHAIIARDWYRFAEIDARLVPQSHIQEKFLIYNRAWGNTREYRLKFMELLIKHGLHESSKTSISRLSEGNQGYHYHDHTFKNVNFAIEDSTVLDLLEDNRCDSNESAQYNHDDFNSTAISVVLETMFDNSRIHLTEKTLRPIACGHPFVLAAGPGSLEYLRSYGFQTFAPWIDESYDHEPDSLRRLEKIINSMNKINLLDTEEFDQFLIEIRHIADFNKKHFFSDAFQQQVIEELKTNLTHTIQHIKKPRGIFPRALKKKILKADPSFFDTKYYYDYYCEVIRLLRSH